MHLRSVFLLVALSACSQTAQGTASVDADASTKGDLAAFERDGSVFDSAPPPGSGEGTLLFQPALEYTGFDGVHAFQVPISVHGAGSDLELTADDPDAVTITATKLADPTGDSGTYFLLAPRKPGFVTLTATSQGQTAKAKISIATYDPARWEAGNARYQSAGANGDPPCASCHVDGRAIDHSPAVLGSVADAEVARIVLAGEKPGHVAIGPTGCTACAKGGETHHWTVTADELAGLVTYLRALEPRGFD